MGAVTTNDPANAAKGLDTTPWLGRTETCTDQISHNLAVRIAATLGEPTPAPGGALPLLWHWAYFQQPVQPDGIGQDGHPARGGFLPPAEGRNRMWAGSRLEFHAPLRVGVDAHRVSTITRIEEKHGRTGSLLFVTVRHEISQQGQLALRDDHDIVYREATPPKLKDDAPVDAPQWREDVTPTPTLLFRYSAVTFNGHRIHYDVPYVTEVEGYAGLVVHGPLIATLALRSFVRAHPEAWVKTFAFRGVRPLTVPDAFYVGGRITEPGHAQVWAANQQGAAQRADIEFD